jgi:hypothetical protein
MLRSFGITFSAKSRVECRVFQSGMLPLWNRQKRWPTRSPLMHSSSCWRTVSGLPAITKRSSTICFHVRFCMIFCASSRSWDSAPCLIVAIVR